MDLRVCFRTMDEALRCDFRLVRLPPVPGNIPVKDLALGRAFNGAPGATPFLTYEILLLFVGLGILLMYLNTLS